VSTGLPVVGHRIEIAPITPPGWRTDGGPLGRRAQPRNPTVTKQSHRRRWGLTSGDPVRVDVQPVEDGGRPARSLGCGTAGGPKSLEQRAPSGCIDALLADDDSAEAWAAAVANPGWQLDDRQWERLAAAREPDDPAAAFEVYLRLAATALQDANKNAYRTAVRYLQAGRRAAGHAALDQAFSEHMATLRDQHRRRPTLIAMLDKAKLP
jgi:hypothetical protein